MATSNSTAPAYARRIVEALEEQQRTRAWLAKNVRVVPATITNILSGNGMRHTRDRLETLRRIEKALGLEPDILLRDWGYGHNVDKAPTTQQAIDRDPRIPAAGKEALLALVAHYHRQAGRGASPVTPLYPRSPGSSGPVAAKQGKVPPVPRSKKTELTDRAKRRKPDEEPDSPGSARP